MRLQEEVERRVAREEALSTGAYFGKSALEVGMDIEDKEWDKWKAWAEKETELQQQQRQAVQSGGYLEPSENESQEDVLEALDDGTEESALPT